MNKISVTIRAGKRSYIEEIDMEVQKEMWNEWTTNGANPDLEKMTFEDFHRPIKFIWKDRKEDQYNGNHFIYGWLECFCQSDDVPEWMRESKEMEVEVKNE